MKDEVDLSYR